MFLYSFEPEYRSQIYQYESVQVETSGMFFVVLREISCFQKFVDAFI